MPKHKKTKRKSPFWNAALLGSLFIGWVGGNILDRLSSELIAYWSSAPSGFLFWIAVPLLFLAWIYCLFVLRLKANQLSTFIAFPEPAAARHSGYLARVETLGNDLSNPESHLSVDKMTKEIKHLANGAFVLLGLAAGLIIFLAPRVLG